MPASRSEAMTAALLGESVSPQHVAQQMVLPALGGGMRGRGTAARGRLRRACGGPGRVRGRRRVAHHGLRLGGTWPRGVRLQRAGGGEQEGGNSGTSPVSAVRRGPRGCRTAQRSLRGSTALPARPGAPWGQAEAAGAAQATSPPYCPVRLSFCLEPVEASGHLAPNVLAPNQHRHPVAANWPRCRFGATPNLGPRWAPPPVGAIWCPRC